MPRPTKFTPAAIAESRCLVDEGLRPAQIAQRLGYNLNSLRVRCSQLGIRLRPPRPPVRLGHPNRPALEVGQELPVYLSAHATDRLRQRASLNGTTDAELASELLQVIVRDNLFEAVLSDNQDQV
jgi:hypothetical protein